MKNLADMIKQCQEAGVTEIQTHPDGTVAKLVFGHKPIVKAEKTNAEKIKEDQEKREPRRNAMDLASQLIADKNAEIGK